MADNASEEDGFRNAPVGDFSMAGPRRAMEKALERTRARFGKFHFGLKIGPAWRETGTQIESRNPSRRSELIGTAAEAGREDAALAIAEANAAFDRWRRTPAAERVGYLRAVAARMSERIYELAALIVFEAGKPWREAHADVTEAIDFLNYYAAEMTKLAGEKTTQRVLGEENTTGYVPKGVVGVIAPWNFPLAILTGMTAAALAAGNAVIMKPAEETPLIAGELMRMFERAGLPPGVLNYLPGFGGTAGRSLVESPEVHMIAFTGSREVGREIYREISVVRPGQKYLRTAVIELGGKNGIIVDATADLDEAIPGVLHSAFGYQGQKCSACSRAIVLSEVYEAFARKLVEGSKSLKVGEARFPDTDVGPLISGEAYERIRNYLRKGIEQGGKFLLEGGCDDSDGFYLSPTLVEVGRENVLAREEVFGPVLAVIKAESFEEAMEILNETDYALTGGIYSRTISHIERFKEDARIGNRYINRGITGSIVQRQPFGGFKMSGAGTKAGGENYLKEFMYEVCTTENTSRHGHIPGIERFGQPPAQALPGEGAGPPPSR